MAIQPVVRTTGYVMQPIQPVINTMQSGVTYIAVGIAKGAQEI